MAKKLVVDFDDTICNSSILPRVNEFLKTNYTLDDFHNYLIDDVIPSELREGFYNVFLKDNPYMSVSLIEGAREALEKLNKVYDIYICSACIMPLNPNNSTKLFAYKYEYLLAKLPFLDPKKFVFTNSKEIICCDVFIDDYLGNFKNKAEIKLLFSSYHNRKLSDEELSKKDIKRVNSWKEISNLLLNQNL